MNTIEDFRNYVKNRGYTNGSNFEVVACEYIKDNCDVAGLALLMKYLGDIYFNKLSYIFRKNHELQEVFHKAARIEGTPDALKQLYGKLEDNMILLNSAYAGESEE